MHGLTGILAETSSVRVNSNLTEFHGAIQTMDCRLTELLDSPVVGESRMDGSPTPLARSDKRINLINGGASGCHFIENNYKGLP